MRGDLAPVLTCTPRALSPSAFAPFSAPAPSFSPVKSRRTSVPRRAHRQDACIGPQENSANESTAAWNFRIASLYNAAMLRIISSAATFVAVTDGRARTRGLALAVLFSSIAGITTVASTAHAQAPTAQQDAPKAGKAKPAAGKAAKKAAAASDKDRASARPVLNKAGNKVISLDDEFLVEGKLEKPSAFYVLRRSSTDYDWARLDAVFTPLVLESVQDPLF